MQQLQEKTRHCDSYEKYEKIYEDIMPDIHRSIEIIDDVIYIKSMADESHQDIVKNLVKILDLYLANSGKCKVLMEPFDVKLNYYTKGKDEKNNIVKPDVLVACKDKIIDGKFLAGAPEIVFEVLSTDRKRDEEIKYEKYKQYGVKEYFIVDTEGKTIKYHDFENGKDEKTYGSFDDEITLNSMNYSIKVSDVFGETFNWLLDLMENKEFISGLKK